MRIYADAATLAAYPGGSSVPAADGDRLLRLASQMVDQLLVGRVYDVGADGMPSDLDVAASIGDATCAIVVELSATGVTSPGAASQWDSVSIGSVSLSGRGGGVAGVTALGLPVPPAAVVALLGVGDFQVSGGGGSWSRPLDRVAR